MWFPASWGPSVVEAIQKRNETWLAQNSVIRDPQMFNHSEVAMGPASRELTYKIQKWNVLSDRLQLWRHLFVTKHRQNPFKEGKCKGVDYEEVERKWEVTKEYFQGYKGFTCPFSVNLEATIRGFDIDNMAAQQAIEESKALHARRWQIQGRHLPHQRARPPRCP